jgi:hypothetical protein
LYQGCTVTKTSHLPIRYLLALLWAHPILHISTIRVKNICPVDLRLLLYIINMFLNNWSSCFRLWSWDSRLERDWLSQKPTFCMFRKRNNPETILEHDIFPENQIHILYHRKTFKSQVWVKYFIKLCIIVPVFYLKCKTCFINNLSEISKQPHV